MSIEKRLSCGNNFVWFPKERTIRTIKCTVQNTRYTVAGRFLLSHLYYICMTGTVCAKKKLPLPFNETEWNGSFRSRLIIFRYPFWIRSKSVRIFRPFWIRFNLFPCCAICFSAWQFMILIKERACMLFNWKNGFQRLHQNKDIVLQR